MLVDAMLQLWGGFLLLIVGIVALWIFLEMLAMFLQIVCQLLLLLLYFPFLIIKTKSIRQAWKQLPVVLEY